MALPFVRRRTMTPSAVYCTLGMLRGPASSSSSANDGTMPSPSQTAQGLGQGRAGFLPAVFFTTGVQRQHTRLRPHLRTGPGAGRWPGSRGPPHPQRRGWPAAPAASPSAAEHVSRRGQSTLHAFNGAALWASRIRRSCMFAGHAAGAGPSVIPDDGATHLTDLLAAPRGRRWRRRRWRRPVPTWPGLGSPALLASLPSIGLSGKDLRLDQSAAASPRIALPGVLLLRLRADCCTCTNRLDPPNGPAQVSLLLRRLLPAALRRRCCQGGGSSGTAKCQLHVTESPKPLCEDSP